MKRGRGKQTAVVEVGPAALVPDLSVAAPRVRLGDLLVHSGTVPREALERASQHANGARLGTLLIERGIIDEDDVTRALSEQLHVPVVDLRDAEPNADATAMIDPPDAHRHDVLPLVLSDGTLTVAVADPLDPEVMALLRSLPVEQVHVALGVPSQLRNRVNQTYSALSAVMGHIEEFQSTDISLDESDGVDDAIDSNAPVVQVVNKIVTQALRDRASDVHLEPSEDSVRVRFRIDGALSEVMELPSEMGQALVSRIKIMSDMNIVERRRPQDGQFEMNIDGRALDVRVSTTSTIWGEKTVLRLLDRTRRSTLGDLGMPPDSEELYSRLVNSPYGMIIVGGPTGSGKTTTLYATLSEINRPDINVMTIEDPVEYIFKKVNQIQIHEQGGMTFATGLKSILRQDPDVILVGEIRDVETARIAVQSALTGHRVFSSVHAIDAVSSLYRLLDMGIEPFLITSAIVGVVAQRLVRRICGSCAETFEPSLSDVTLFQKLGGSPDKNIWLRGKGCQFCSGTGYFDRVGVYEVMAITDELRQCVVDGAPPRAARELAAEQGLRTLQNEAIRMVESNVTTMEEIVKHVIVGEEF